MKKLNHLKRCRKMNYKTKKIISRIKTKADNLEMINKIATMNKMKKNLKILWKKLMKKV